MGRMGTVARKALSSLLRRFCAPPIRHAIVASLDDLFAQKPDVLLDLTTQPGVEISLAAVARGDTDPWSAQRADGATSSAPRSAMANERNVSVLII